MNISETFIHRPIATALLMFGILVLGTGAFTLLPIAALPKVDFPTITVTAQLPGASPDTMASSVATPLEQQFAALPGLAQMTSTNGLGSTTITLQFVLDRDIDGAAGDVQTAINAAGGLLPKEMPNPPTYKKTNPADRPVMLISVSSDALPMYRVDDYAYTLLAQKISTIPGVSQVTIAGEQQYAPHIQVNPLALAARGIGLEDVRNALAGATLDQAKGTLEGDHLSYTLDTNDQLFDAQGFSKVIVAYRNGAPVRITDIAAIRDGVQNARVAAFENGGPAEVLLVLRQPGANSIEISDQIKKLLPVLQASIPPAVSVRIISDRSLTIRASVNDVERTLLISIALVVVVIFLFLRSLRITIIPAITVPLSLVGTFGVMYVLGYSLDNLSLMALTISVGFVVDDAIVMIENIVRYVEDGESPMQAALRGAGQIGFTIVSITCSLVAVFIPLLFMSGLIGRLFREFAVTVTVAVAISAFIALTLTPVMCSLLLRHERVEDQSRLSRGLERGFAALLAGYEKGLVWVFRHRRLTLVSTLLLIVATLVLYMMVPKGFFPEQDTGFIFASVEARQDISYKGIVTVEHQLAAIMDSDPAVGAVVGLVGVAGQNTAENAIRMYLQLKPFDQRDATAQQVIQRLRPRVAHVPGALVFMQAGQDVTVGARLAKTEYQYTLTDTDNDELNDWSLRILNAMKHLPQLQDVGTDQQIAAAHLAIQVDRDAASRLGLSLSQIDATLYDAFGQRQVGTIYTSDNTYKVILEVEPRFQDDPTALSRIYVAGPTGKQIPLSTVARFTPKIEALTVNHQGQFPAVTLSFNLAPGMALSDAVTAIGKVMHDLRAPISLQGAFQGNAQAFQSSLTTMPILMAAAILAVYIVLGMLYESFIHPITILSALPSAGVGALLMLMGTGNNLDLIALIGIILLIGIVKKNAIMMIDFALDAERNGGKTPEDAIFQACLLRFRPIMMTTMAALLSGLPLALGHGAGAELRRPLGIAIVGGLLLSQILTLYTTPIIYLYLDRFSRVLDRGLRPKPTASGPQRPPALVTGPDIDRSARRAGGTP